MIPEPSAPLVVDGVLYVAVVRADGGTFEGGGEPVPWMSLDDD